jgi:hypothetical protein
MMISESKMPQTFAEKIDEMIGSRLARQLQSSCSASFQPICIDSLETIKVR